MIEYKDAVRSVTTTTGTETITLDNSAIPGYQSVTAHSAGATVQYRIENADRTEWENGEGVLNAERTTLTRPVGSVSASSNSGGLVNFSAGTKIVETTINASSLPRNYNQQLLQDDLDNNGIAYLKSTDDFLVDGLTMPAGSKIIGNGTIRWNSDSLLTNTIIINNNCSIIGITFRRLQSATALTNSKVILSAPGNNSNVLFESLSFIADLDGSDTTFENFIKFDQHCTSMRIVNCNTQYGGDAILAIACTNSFFINNTFTDPSSAGLRFYGGKYNKIIGNKIYGRNVHNTTASPSNAGQSTKVGINFLSFGFLGSNTGVIGNQIIGNEVYGVSEEGIGIDTHGETFANTFENKTLPIATVYSIAQSSNWQVITLQESTTVNSVPADIGWAHNSYVIVLTGGAAGYIAPVIAGQSTASGSVNTATITIPNVNGTLGAVNGDKICITYGAIDNIISNNFIHSTTTGISLWGSAFRNTISGNTVNAIEVGIQVAEVLGGPVTPNMNSYVLSYAGMNIITNNDIRLEFPTQSSAIARGWSPLVVGVWAYGTISTNIPHHIGTEITNNRIFSARNSIIGGTILGMNDPGALSIYGGTLSNNRYYGGGGFAVNKTSNLYVGPNYTHVTKENYKVAASASNTALVEVV